MEAYLFSERSLPLKQLLVPRATSGPSSSNVEAQKQVKCKYRFSVDAELRPGTTAPIVARGLTWLFELSDGVVTHLSVTVPLPNEKDWPSISKQQKGPVRANVNPNLVHLPRLQHDIRSIQGLLAVFGLRGIDTAHYEVEWLPDSPEEKEKLKMYTFSTSAGKVAADDILPISFDLLARAVIGSPVSSELEIPLNFFRRARVAHYEREYIQATYSFFFVLETLFGNGKNKKRALISALLSVATLGDAISTAISNGPIWGANDAHLIKQFNEQFSAMSVAQYIEHIVELRGFLHHHALKRQGIWDPNRQHKFQLDSLLLSDITFHVLFNLAWDHMDSPTVVNELKRQISTFIGVPR